MRPVVAELLVVVVGLVLELVNRYFGSHLASFDRLLQLAMSSELELLEACTSLCCCLRRSPPAAGRSTQH